MSRSTDRATAPRSGPTNEPLFFDDFSSGRLDRSKWNVRTTGRVVNDEQQAYIDAPDTVFVSSGTETEGADGNVLVLQPRFRPGYTSPDGDRFDFVSGRIDTRERFQFRYGSASARIKLPDGRGLWPAFWLMGGGNWPETGEIDVMEYVGEPDWVSSAVHGPGYSGEQGLVNYRYFADRADATEWHVYSVDWEQDRLVFRVDGAIVYRVTRPMVEFFGPWSFDNEKFLILNFAVGGIYPFKTSGIDSPYHGMSQAATDAIKTERAKVLVDWVRVEPLGSRKETS